MRSRDSSFSLALAASILLHVAMVFIVADEALRRARPGDAVAPPAAATRQAVEYVARTPPPPQKLDALFGDANGTGDAANARRGEEPMVGREGGQTQAFLSRDPVGSGSVFKEPSMSVLPTGSVTVAPALSAPPPPPPSQQLFGLGDRSPRRSAPHVTRTAPPVPPPAAGADAPGSAGVPLPAADPAVMSDSESDPFTRTTTDAAVEFRDGHVEARLGRKVKTIRPHLSLASRLDLLGMRFPRMVVRVHVNADGSVRRVDIVKPSGSESADQEVKIALYRWWFEPTKEDVVEFPIVWR